MKKINLKRVLAAILAVVCVMLFASCSVIKGNGTKKIAGDTVVLSIGGQEVTYDEYRYFYMNNKLSMDAGDDNYWTSNPNEIETLNNYTLESLAQYCAIQKAADENGVEVTDDIKQESEDIIKQYIETYGSEENFDAALVESYLTRELFKKIYCITGLETSIYNKLVEEDNVLNVTEADIKAKLNSEDYIRVYHILYEDEETAKATLETAKGATDEEFYQLAQSAEDPGMVGNEAGYVFTYDEMVEPFEEASFAMEVGETSDLVKSDFGYHIIRKLEKTPEFIDENYESLAPTFLQMAYYEYLDAFVADMKEDVVYKDEFAKIDFLVKEA